jgi:hypothetical protein
MQRGADATLQKSSMLIGERGLNIVAGRVVLQDRVERVEHRTQPTLQSIASPQLVRMEVG